MLYENQVVPTDVAQNLLPVMLTQSTEEVYPASLPQERLWFLDQLRGMSTAYNVHVGIRLKGPLDGDALRAALTEIVRRHDSFRTTFRFVEGKLVQVVAGHSSARLQTDDVTAAADPAADAYEIAREEVQAPFDLGTGPLFRTRLIRLSPEDHVFLCTMHHIVTDSWSMQVFVRELTALYTAFSTGQASPLAELPIRYGDYAEWQRECFDSDALQNQIAYWREKLRAAPPLLRLPTDHPRPPEQTFAGSSQTALVSEAVVAKIKKLAGTYHCTPFMVLLAAFKALLIRYSGQSDVLVGVPVAGRNRIETESLIGFFVNTLVLRDDLSGNLRFFEVLTKVRETALSAFANADIPFEKIVEIVKPERNLSFNPLFQVMFSSIKAAVQTHTFGELRAYPYVVSANSSIFDLIATLIEATDGQWWMQFEYNTDLFSHERIGRMLADYGTLLEAVVDRPEIRMGQILLSGADQPSAVAPEPFDTAESSSEYPADAAAAWGDAELETTCQRLQEIWKNVLGLPAVGIHDNFFDIGGHSLLAARLVRDIEKTTGQTIRVSAMFRAPTIASLARLLSKGHTSSPDPIVMKLRQGSGAQALFAVAIPGVDSFGFAMLAHHMQGDHPVYKLQAAAPVIWGRPFSADELHSLAEKYIAAMRAVQPEGPYSLAAMCDGVLLAQVMLAALEAQGSKISLFTVFDTWVVQNTMWRPLWALDYYHHRLQLFLDASWAERWEITKRVFARMVGRSHAPRRGGWRQVYWPGKNFQPPRFQAPVLLFKGPRQPFYYLPDREMGWGQRTSGGVEICEIDCRHFEMLRDPHIQLVAEKISSRMLIGSDQGAPLASSPELADTARISRD